MALVLRIWAKAYKVKLQEGLRRISVYANETFCNRFVGVNPQREVIRRIMLGTYALEQEKSGWNAKQPEL